MIFVTVGSQKFQFDRLLRAVDECVENGLFEEAVFAQTGACDYRPRGFESSPYLGRAEFAQKIDMADVVITHGGTGVIVGALKKGKRVIAMARLSCYGEHVDDHQAQLLKEFKEAGLIAVCEDGPSLARAYTSQLERGPACYRSTNSEFIADLGQYLDSCLRD